MADNLTQIVDFDVSQGLNAVTKIEKVLAKYGQTVDDIAKIESKLNKETEAQQLKITTQIDQYQKLNVILEKHGSFWVELSDQTKKYADTLKLATQVELDNIKAQEKALAAEKALATEREKQNRININIRRQHAQETIAIIKAANANVIAIEEATQAKLAADEEKNNRILIGLRRKRALETINLIRQEHSQRQLAESLLNFGGDGEDYGKKAQKIVEANNKITLSWQSVIRLFTIQFLHQVISSLKNELEEAVHSAQEFAIRVAEIQTISQQAGLTTAQWEQGLRALSDQFGSPLLQTAEGAYQALSNQVVHGAETFQFLNSEMKLSLITVSSLHDAVSATTAVMNSYGASTDEAEHINAVLFKTVELGRVRLEQMADQLGKVSTLSHQLGLSFEEQQASLVLLTQKGLQFTTAQTLVDNVLLKLAKPTKEMTALFKEWGVTTGESAIKTFGFVGVLQKLEQATKSSGEGLSEIADVFRDLRSIIGGDILTNTDEYRKILDKFHESAGDAAKALNIVLDNQGKQLQVQLNRIKNFFTVDFGNSILNFLVGGAKGTGDLADKVIYLTRTVIDLGEAFLIYKAAQYAINAGTTIFNNLLNQEVIAAKAAAEGLTIVDYQAKILNATLSSLGSAGIGLAIYGFVSLYNEASRFFDEIANAGSQALSRYQELERGITEGIIEHLDAEKNAFAQSYNDRVSVFLKYAAQIQAANDHLSESIKKSFKEAAEGAANDFKEAFRQIEDQVRSFESAASKAEHAAARLKEDAQRTREHGEDNAFFGQLQGLDEGKQIDFIKKQIKKYQDEAEDLIKKGDFEAAERRFTRLSRLNDELQRKLQKEVVANDKGGATDAHLRNLQKRAAEIAQREAELAHGRQNLLVPDEHRRKPGQAPKVPSIHVQNHAELNRLLREQKAIQDEIARITRGRADGDKANNKIAAERAAQEKEVADNAKKFADLQEQAAKAQEAQANADKKRADSAKQLQDQLHKAFDALYHPDLTDLDKAEKSIKENEKIIQDILIKGGVEKDARLQAEDAINKAEEALKKESNRRKTDDALKAIRQQISDADRLFKEANEQQSKAEKAVPEADKNRRDVIEKQVAELEKFFDSVRVDVNSFDKAAEIFEKNGLKLDTQNVSGAIGPLLHDIANLNAQRGVINGTDKEATAQRDALYNKLTNLLGELEKLFFHNSNIFGANVQDEHGHFLLNPGTDIGATKRTSKDLRDDYSDVITKVTKAQKALADAQANFGDKQALIKKLEDEQQSIISKITDVELKKAVVEEKFITAQERIAKAFEGIADKLLGLDKNVKRGQDPAVGLAKGGMVPNYLAYGGFPGGPRGTDTIPAWLSPGEYVLDALTVKRFYPLIRAMHQPKYFSQGGAVTTVGDINISVQGGQSSEMTIRQIAQGLRRELKRGTIKLD